MACTMSGGVTVVADATDLARQRIERVLNADTGLGVPRYADAGDEIALKAREWFKLGVDAYPAARVFGARA